MRSRTTNMRDSFAQDAVSPQTPCGAARLTASHVYKTYGDGPSETTVLHDISLDFAGPAFVAILGPSGCGKTTLLNVLGGLDLAFSGDVGIDGCDVRTASSRETDSLRGERVGFVFQDPRLIDYLVVEENVAYPLRFSAVPPSEQRSRARQALSQVGMGAYAGAHVDELSGGQAQRVAIARALAKGPGIVLADEPTGSLDKKNGRAVMELLAQLARTRLVVVVTHDEPLAREFATRIVRMDDGRIVGDESNTPRAARDERESKICPGASPHAHAASGRLASVCRLWPFMRRNLSRHRFRTAVCALAVALSASCLIASLSLAAGGGSFVGRLVLSRTLGHPLIASADVAVSASTTSDAATNAADDSDALAVEDALGGVLATALSTDHAPSMLMLETQLSASSELTGHVLDIQRDSGLELNLYSADGAPVLENGLSQLTERMDIKHLLGADAAERIDAALGSISMMRELVLDDDGTSEAYRVVAGRMPQEADEIVLITGADGRLRDYTACTLGFLDDDTLMERAMSGVQDEESRVAVSCDDVLGTTYRIISTAAYYARDGEEWEDLRDDPDHIAQALDGARELTVVGVVCPQAAYASGDEAGAIGYPPGLEDAIAADAESYEIVRDQRERPAVNVFTGESVDAGLPEQVASAAEECRSSLVTIARDRGFSQAKVALIEGVSAAQLEALGRAVGVEVLDESDDAGAGDSLQLEAALPDEQLERLRAMSDEEFAELIDAHAPACLNATYEQNMRWLGAISDLPPSGLRIYPRDTDGYRLAQEVVAAFNELQGEGVRAVTCASDIQQWTNQVAGAIDAVRFALGGVTVAVAALSVALVASVTVIAAMERRDELAILRALGASRRDAVVLLVGGNAIVGLFAGLVGGVLALVVAGALDPIVTQAIGASGLFTVPAWVVLPAALLGAALAALSALVPAVLSQK